MEYIYLSIAAVSLALNIILTVFLIKNTKNMKSQTYYSATETVTLNPKSKQMPKPADAGINETLLMNNDNNLKSKDMGDKN